jgi:Ser/Thr protein kinase RdoA (MazF antagonist)
MIYIEVKPSPRHWRKQKAMDRKMATRLDPVTEKLGKIYGLDIHQVEPINRGEVNYNFEIATNEGKFFLREYGDKIIRNEEDLVFEHRALDHLMRHGFTRLARPREVRNFELREARYPYPTLVRIGEKYFAVFDFIEGRDASHLDLKEAARTLAYFHKAIENFEHPYSSFFIEDMWEKQLRQYEGLLAGNQRKDYFDKTLDRFLPQVKHYLNTFKTNIHELDNGLEKLACHNDYHLGNIRMRAKKAYITDFEGVGHNYRTYELAFATIAFGTQEDPGDLEKEKDFWEKARKFLKNYININGLHPEEIELMPGMIKATYVKLLPRIIRHHYQNTYETDKRIRDETLTTITNSLDWCEEHSQQMIADLRIISRQTASFKRRR